MTAAALPTPSPLWLDELQAAMNTPFDATALSTGQAREVLRTIGTLEAQLAGRKIAVARELDRQQVATSSGHTSTGALIAGDFGRNRAAGDRLVRTAKNLESATRTDAALSAGSISL